MAGFLAYLWGIETCKHSKGKMGGQPVFSLPMRNWNLQVLIPPIEHKWVFSLPMRNWNFNSRSIPILSRGVFSLPMRNWNEENARRAKEMNRFLAYLWGIETPLWNAVILGFVWFLAYLWGIETLSFRWCKCFLWLVFSLPMRNWNRSSCNISAVDWCPFLAYLCVYGKIKVQQMAV